jgi:hypothetical protein
MRVLNEKLGVRSEELEVGSGEWEVGGMKYGVALLSNSSLLTSNLSATATFVATIRFSLNSADAMFPNSSLLVSNFSLQPPNSSLLTPNFFSPAENAGKTRGINPLATGKINRPSSVSPQTWQRSADDHLRSSQQTNIATSGRSVAKIASSTSSGKSVCVILFLHFVRNQVSGVRDQESEVR